MRARLCESCGVDIEPHQEKISCEACGAELCEGCADTDVDGLAYCLDCTEEG